MTKKLKFQKRRLDISFLALFFFFLNCVFSKAFCEMVWKKIESPVDLERSVFVSVMITSG